MKFKLIIFILIFLISKNSFSNNAQLTNYILKDCYVEGQVLQVKVDLNKKTASFDTTIDGYDYPTIKIDLERIKDNELTSSKFFIRKMVNPNYSYTKWQKLAFDHTLVNLRIFPNLKKVNLVFNSTNTTNKNIIKAFKKVYGVKKVINMQQEFSCLSLVALEINEDKKTPKTIDGDRNKIIAASSGSGFFISNSGHTISNFHVIDNCDKISVFSRGRELEASVISSDKINDLSILKVKYNPSSIFSLSNEDVSLLEDVIVAGFPLGKNVSAAIKTHKGVVTSLAGAGDNYSNFQTDAAINQGNSGGPIVNQKGNVVGVAVASWVEEGVQGVHFGIKSSTLKTFVNSNGLNLQNPSNKDLSNKDLGNLITNATVYIECNMTVAKIKKMLNDSKNRKAFFSNIK